MIREEDYERAEMLVNLQRDAEAEAQILAAARPQTPEDALQRIKSVLGRGLYPAAVPEVLKVLEGLEESAESNGFRKAQETVGEWHRPLGA